MISDFQNKRDMNLLIINKIINGNKANITETIAEELIKDAKYSIFNETVYINIFFDLKDKITYKVTDGQGFSEDIIRKTREGVIIRVFRFQSGKLYELAKECVLIDFEDEDVKYDIFSFKSEVERKIEQLAKIYAEIDIDYDENLDFYLEHKLFWKSDDE